VVETTPALAPNQDPAPRKLAAIEGVQPHDLSPNTERAAPRGPVGFVPDDAVAGPTWGELFDWFRDEKLSLNISPGTVDQHWYAFHPLVRWMQETLGHDHLADLREDQARAFLKQAKEVGVSDRGPVDWCRRNHLLTLNRRTFDWLLKRGLVAVNPFAGIEKATEHPPIIPTFSEQQVAALLSQPDTQTWVGLRDWVLMALLWGTGLRLIEALNLRLPDLDLNDLRRGRAWVMGKGGKEAFVALPPRLCTDLRHQYLPERAAMLEANRVSTSPWVFPGDRGGRLSKRTVQDNVRGYGERAGIEGVRCSPHTLRHSYAVALWLQCHDLETVRRALRHADIRQTQRYLESLGANDVIDWVRDLSPLQTMELPPLRGRRIRRRPNGDNGAASDRGSTS